MLLLISEEVEIVGSDGIFEIIDYLRYETGKFKNKKNTFHDFISCADELVKAKVTNHEKMAIEGRSAGGLLIGATLNMKPDIASVAVAGVPFVDVINTSKGFN
jgi:oligopeptidase B